MIITKENLDDINSLDYRECDELILNSSLSCLKDCRQYLLQCLDKVGTNCKIKINDLDFNLLCKSFIREEIDVFKFNELKTEYAVNLWEIEKVLISKNFKILAKQYYQYNFYIEAVNNGN